MWGSPRSPQVVYVCPACTCLVPGELIPLKYTDLSLWNMVGKYMLHSPRSQNDKARNDFQWVFLGEGSWTQRRKMTHPRPPSQLVAELGLECRFVVLCSYCTSLLTPQLPKKAATKIRNSDFMAFSVPVHVTCLDFPSHIQNKVGRRLTR